jgi:hypothetical protein
MENNTFKVIVAGGRDFFDYDLMKRKLDVILSKKDNVVIVSGTAKGADSLGERYAREHNLVISYFPALWHIYGSKAGFYRNEEMAEYAEACICFWDGKSTGTKHMIDTAEDRELLTRVIRYK